MNRVGIAVPGHGAEVVAYQAAAWNDLFVGVIGAAAALAGLIFVAVALNHEQILRLPALPALAARSLAVLIGLVLLATFVLTPGQSRMALGVELTILGLMLAAGTLGVTVRAFDPNTPLRWRAGLLAVSIGSTVPMVVAGLSVLTATGGGLYWALAETVCGFVAAAYYAWILLIEIRR